MQKNKIIYIIIGLFVVGFAAWAASMNRPQIQNPQDTTEVTPTSTEIIATVTPTSSTPTKPTPTPKPSSTTGTSTGPKTYTLVDIAKHSKASNCWTSINGGVYDLTSWISQHPGGEEAILSICGIDGTAAFNDQHGGAQKQASILATFKIGALAK